MRTLRPASSSMRDDLGGRDDLEPAGVAEARRAGRRARPGRRARRRPGRAGDDLAGGLVAAHGVDRDGQHASRESGCGQRPRQSTSMAWRPSYQPQLPQTTWGSLADPQRGQRLRAGASSVQAEARRLRLFALEVFFLGTAMTRFPALCERMPGSRCGGRLMGRQARGQRSGDSPTGEAARPKHGGRRDRRRSRVRTNGFVMELVAIQPTP